MKQMEHYRPSTMLAILMAVGLSATASAAQTPPAVSPVPAAQQIAQTSPQTNAPPTAKNQPAKASLSDKDKNFVQMVAKGGALQIALSKVEVEQGRNPKVKKYALETVENMSKAAGMLHAIASNFGVNLPQQPPQDVQKLTKALSEDKGNLVDSEYMAQLVPASTVAVNLFKNEANSGQNPKLVDFAKEMLPKLEKHQKMAVQISENMGKATAQSQPSASTGQQATAAPHPRPPKSAGKP